MHIGAQQSASDALSSELNSDDVKDKRAIHYKSAEKDVQANGEQLLTTAAP